MKACLLHATGAIALTFGLAACVPQVERPAPPPPPVQTPAPASTPTPSPPPVVQQPVYDNYLDAPQTPGDWEYQLTSQGPVAAYVGTDGTAQFRLSCDRSQGQIGLWRAGTSATPRAMRILTETTTRQLSVAQAGPTNPYLTTTLNARDPLLDAMAITKGRFAVEVEGQRSLYLPAWVEVSRVIEDCR